MQYRVTPKLKSEDDQLHRKGDIDGIFNCPACDGSFKLDVPVSVETRKSELQKIQVSFDTNLTLTIVDIETGNPIIQYGDPKKFNISDFKCDH